MLKRENGQRWISLCDIDSGPTENHTPPPEMEKMFLRDIFRFASLILEIEPQMREKLFAGGHIFELGGGDGSDVFPFLIALASIKADSVKFLLTDILDYPDFGMSFPLAWRWMFEQAGSNGFQIDHPWYRDQVVLLDSHAFFSACDRMCQSFGAAWDGTKPEVFENARELLEGEIGLVVLRHPEIGTEDEEKTEVFRKIIQNMLNECLEKGTPLLITTSNNPDSWKRIKDTIAEYFEEFGYCQNLHVTGDMFEEEELGWSFEKDDTIVHAHWGIGRRNYSHEVGLRKLDYRVLRIFLTKKGKITE